MQNTLQIIRELPGIRPYAAVLAVTYGAVAVSMAADFVAGVRKARKNGIATNSRGYKRTCDKAVKYFLPMVCLTCIDIIAGCLLTLPLLTMAMGAFNIFCEWVSVLESAYDKRSIRSAASAVKDAVAERDNLRRLLGRLLETLTDKEKGGCDEKDN